MLALIAAFINTRVGKGINIVAFGAKIFDCAAL
jgi:hypothetical protein